MSGSPQLSVVVPVHNEEDNVAPLVAEILAALRGRIDFEIVYVDDTSRDATLARLREIQTSVPELRVIRHLTNAGQSTAVRNGVKAARARGSPPSTATARTTRPTSRTCWQNATPRRPRSSCSPAGASTAGIPAASAGPRSSPTRSAHGCCATPPRTPAAGSSCSNARRSSTCPTSTTCTATCRR
ncbi:glycosyltransferase family 2 protein [Thermomonas sp. S9]|nr:glycosyltransferase family 2 protein [Thermomonas sp. S9]